MSNSFGLATTITYEELCAMSSLVIPLDEKNKKNPKSPTTKWFITDKDNYIYMKEEKPIPTIQKLSAESAKKLFELAYDFIPNKKKPKTTFFGTSVVLCLKYQIVKYGLNVLNYVTKF